MHACMTCVQQDRDQIHLIIEVADVLMVSKFSQSEIGIWVLVRLLLPLSPRTIIGDIERISKIFTSGGGIFVLSFLCGKY